MIAGSVVTRALVLSIVVLVASAGLGCRTQDATAEADGARYVLGIEGMACAESCPPQVKSSLEGIPGVKSVEVSFDEKRAVVRMSAGHELSKEAADKSFGNKGYFVSSFVREDAVAAEPAPSDPAGAAAN